MTRRSSSSRSSRPLSTAQGKPANLLLRGLEPELLAVFRSRAERHGHSLQAELHLSLRREAHRNFDEAARISEQWQARLAGHNFGQTRAMLEEDRKR
jgi:plasmid stability protein